MGEELDQFIEEQKAKLAQDKADLEKDPPYMEIRSKRSELSLDADKLRAPVTKENILPNRQSQRETTKMKQTGDTGYGLSLPLGEDYERKKHKLKEELRQDYRRYLNQGNAQAKRKKHLRSTGELDPATQGMSLPIGERNSAKERLRFERNREYNQFLRMKEEEHDRFRLEIAGAVVNDAQIQKPAAVIQVKPEEYPPVQMSHRDHDHERSQRDAYTSMEAYEGFLNRRRSEEDRHHRPAIEIEAQERRGRRAEEELLYRKYGRADRDSDRLDRPSYITVDLEHERRPLRLNLAPDASEDNRQRYDLDPRDRRPVRNVHQTERILPRRRDTEDNYEYRPEQASYYQVQRSDNRPYRERRDREPPIDYEDDFREQSNRRPNTSLTKARLKAEIPLQTNERAKSANLKEESFSTGLQLGGSDKEEAQKRRKERYRQELMEQMAEQQRNKRREKELELKVAASGAIDPEKQPDRLRQFGAINRHQDLVDRNVPYRPGAGYDPETTARRNDPKHAVEERVPPEKPRVAFQTPVPETAVPGSNYPGITNFANEEYHRALSNTLGEIVAPKITAVPPPQPPVLTDNYRTPYDDAYYFYGARNPLDPNLAYYPPNVLGYQSVPEVGVSDSNLLPHPQEQTFANRHKIAAGRGTSLGLPPEEKLRATKEAAQSYQVELEQQIRERNEKRRKEKEEQERYDSKLEAEMKNYNPWGKGGGGAPLRDSKGNLITDLKRMHKVNEDAYQNPEAKAYEDKRAVVALDMSLADNVAPTSKIPGFSYANSSSFARGNVFSEPPTDQHVQQQESYKNFLRQQIEEKRRKEEEERERIRLEEEREERRIAEQRAKIQREYEEEQNRKKLKEEEQRQKNEELIRLADERKKEAERKRKEEEEKHEEELRRYYDQEKAVTNEQERPPRQSSPVIPALQHKVSSRVQRPTTTESHISLQSNDVPQSRPVSPPVPARRNQLRAYDERKDVINELSELKKQLRSEQRRLAGQLLDADRDDDSPASLSGRRREKNSVDVFELARQRLQATVRRPSSKGPDAINMQNIREFNNLKYRDTDTREGVRHMYPDPPKDDQTLDIQQQALLREQQRNLNRMKRRTVMLDDFETAPAYSLRHPGMLRNPAHELMSTSLLESESAFIGENGEPFPPFVDPSPDLQPLPSARERRRHKNKALDFDGDFPTVPPLPLHQPDTFSVHSGSSVNVDELRIRNEERLRRLSNLQKNSFSTDNDPYALGDAEDILKPFPAKDVDRPLSVDTVATDPWLRPGTSETLKRFMAGQMIQEKAPNESAFNLNWQGLSTAHG